jgi:hypothetical protein
METSTRNQRFYPLVRNDKFRFFAGGGAIGELGGIYNERNSNNPGSLKVSVNLDAAAMAMYRLKNVTFRWQLSTPFLGMFFSPEYGHSYYEIFSLGKTREPFTWDRFMISLHCATILPSIFRSESSLFVQAIWGIIIERTLTN